MNKLDIVKTAASITVGAGVSKIVHQIIDNNVNPEKAIEKIYVAAGAMTIGMMAKDASKTYVNAKIDSYAELVTKIKNKVNEAQAEKQD